MSSLLARPLWLTIPQSAIVSVVLVQLSVSSSQTRRLLSANYGLAACWIYLCSADMKVQKSSNQWIHLSLSISLHILQIEVWSVKHPILKLQLKLEKLLFFPLPLQHFPFYFFLVFTWEQRKAELLSIFWVKSYRVTVQTSKTPESRPVMLIVDIRVVIDILFILKVLLAFPEL